MQLHANALTKVLLNFRNQIPVCSQGSVHSNPLAKHTLSKQDNETDFSIIDNTIKTCQIPKLIYATAC